MPQDLSIREIERQVGLSAKRSQLRRRSAETAAYRRRARLLPAAAGLLFVSSFTVGYVWSHLS
jgi:hypothetical protein